MCLATPVQVKSKVKSQKSKVIVDGGKTIDISLVPGAKVGDWLLCHGGLAINKIQQKEAQEILDLCKCTHH